MATIAEFINKVGFQVKKEDVDKVNNTVNNIKSSATKVLGAIGIGVSLSSANALIEEFTRVKDQVKNSTKGLGEQAEIQGKILAAASATRSEYSQTASMVSNLVKENSELFGNVDEAIKFNNAATMLFKTAGKTNSEIAGLMTAINKSFAKGYVDSETLSQMLEKSPEAVELLNKRLGSTSDQLEQLARDGKFTVQDLKAAFVDNAQSIENSFKSVQMTISDALSVIRNQWGLWLADTNQMLGVTNSIGKIMVSAFEKFMAVLTKIRAGVMWLADKLGGTKNLLKLIAIAASTLYVAFNFQKIKTGLTALKTLISGISVKTLAIAAAVILLALLVEDLINFVKGNDSLIGEFLAKAGVDCDDVRDKFGQLADTFKELWGIVKELASALLSLLAEALGVLLTLLMELVAALLPVVLELLMKLVQVCVQIIQMILPVVLKLIQSLMPILTKIVQSILPPILGLISAIIPHLIEIVDAILPVIIDLVNALLPVLLTIVESVLPIVITLLDAILPLLGPVLDLVTSLVTAVLPIVLTLLNAIVAILMPLVDIVVNLVMALLPIVLKLVTAIVSILQPLLGIVTNLITSLLPIVVSLIEAVLAILMPLLDIVIELVMAILPIVVSLLDVILTLLTPLLDIIILLVTALLPVIVTILSALIPIIQVIFAVLKPVLDLVVLLVDALAKVVGWMAEGLSGVVEMIFGGFSGSTPKNLAAYADGTDYSEDTFVAGEEGPELITNQRGKKVFTALQTGEIFNGLAKLSMAKTPTPQTASVVTSNTDSRKNIVQNVEINNKFEGDTAIQKKASTAMDKSAKDVTSELARGLAYT